MILGRIAIAALSLSPASSNASSDGLDEIFLGYLSIYVVIPILVLIPTIRLILLSRRDLELKKKIIPSIAIALVSLAVLFALGTQYFSFNFKPPYHIEHWESLYLLVLPSTYFLFQKGNNSNAT